MRRWTPPPVIQILLYDVNQSNSRNYRLGKTISSRARPARLRQRGEQEDVNRRRRKPTRFHRPSQQNQALLRQCAACLPQQPRTGDVRNFVNNGIRFSHGFGICCSVGVDKPATLGAAACVRRSGYGNAGRQGFKPEPASVAKQSIQNEALEYLGALVGEKH